MWQRDVIVVFVIWWSHFWRSDSLERKLKWQYWKSFDIGMSAVSALFYATEFWFMLTIGSDRFKYYRSWNQYLRLMGHAIMVTGDKKNTIGIFVGIIKYVSSVCNESSAKRLISIHEVSSNCGLSGFWWSRKWLRDTSVSLLNPQGNVADQKWPGVLRLGFNLRYNQSNNDGVSVSLLEH